VGEGWEEEKVRLLAVMGGRIALDVVVLNVMAIQERRMVLAALCVRCEERAKSVHSRLLAVEDRSCAIVMLQQEQ
jgi:hypothetical protein